MVSNKPSFLKTILLLAILVVLALLVTFSRLDLSSKQNTAKRIQTVMATKSASETPAAEPKVASPTAVLVPAQSGRSFAVPILTYHYIGNNPNPADKLRDNLEVTPDKFEEEMGYLSKNGYQPISLDTLYAALKGQANIPPKAVILTFDDGYVDFYLNAFPILRKYNLHAIAFIPTGLMNQGYYLSWAQIKEIDSSGLVVFQAHSVNHLNLTTLSYSQLLYQLKESKKTLEANLGKTVNFVAYPYGASNPQVWQAANEAGYIGAVGTYFGRTESEGNIYDLPREKIGGGFTLNDFISRL